MTVEKYVILAIILLVLLCIFSYILIGEILLRCTVKRNNFVGRQVKRVMDKTYQNYKIDYKWWANFSIQEFFITTDDNVKIYYEVVLNEKPTSKFAVVIHGYYARYTEMNKYAELFLNLGYNVILTQNRAHGKSGGNFIGMGWLDRLDILKVLQSCISRYGKESEYVIFGLSMGGATVCMLSGEELPQNVTHLISDCGYDCVYDVFKHVFEFNVRIKSRVFLRFLDYYLKLRCGYSLKQADARYKLPDCKVPILFIHGDKDTFVPFFMQRRLYDSTPENLRYMAVFKNAEHAESLPHNEVEYKKTVSDFLRK